MEPIKITATIDAWLPSTRASLDNVLNEKDPKEQVSMLCYSNMDMASGSYPWVRVGTAEITVTLMSRSEVAASQITTLEAELAQERAKWLTVQESILTRISKLQALEFSPEAA